MDLNDSKLIVDALLSTESDAIVAADRDGLIQFWNPGAERIFGHSAQEARGHSLDIIIPERLRERHWQGFAKVMQTGESRYGSGDLLAVPALRKDGSTISVEFTITTIRQDGQIVGMIAILRDVTKQFQEMRELKRAASRS
ncbi:MAG: PAS domain S-box protein [Xanthobacteraceae bacterium]